MLGKLIKYEIKATGRTLLPLYAVLLIFALINKIFIGDNLHAASSNFLGGIPFMLSMLAYICTMVAIFIVTFFVIIQRFYKNLLGDQGYLMHTLPVSCSKNITSKLLVAVIWSIISTIVAITSIIIMAFNPTMFVQFFKDLANALSQINAHFGISAYMVGIEFIIAALLQVAVGTMMIYASISIGHLFNKRKILSSFGAFILLNIIMNTIVSVLGINFSSKLEAYFNIASNSSLAPLHVVFGLAIIINIIFFICYFVITNYIIKNKLNLE
ncbi:ABC transporter permease [Clostridium uliginosum]|uniref:ABC-2 family transporter protein n=1 Tax=Clostridium uliginosum TaxID=119641 RepID=A0A1I1I0C9_9CLOT|nr:ABC transporter permease [Clostridium uliginosum]SFC29551.1 hypothetical protein SAMN05421842_10273 [Clostridium uliginosum]